MKNDELGRKVIELIGSEKNVSSLTHCATRLRFVLKDQKRANKEELEKLDGVIRVQESGGQFQVVIGPSVNKVYSAIMSNTQIDSSHSDQPQEKRSLFVKFTETVSGIFTPILPALIGCGMVKCLSSVLVSFGLIGMETGFIQVLNLIGDSVFYFLPFYLAVSSAKKFNTNQYIAITLAACYLYPTILNGAAAVAETGVTSLSFLGLPILFVKYTSTVIPIIVSVWILSYVYRFFEKYIPEVVNMILVPMLSLFVMVPVSLIAIGPIGSYLGSGLSGIISGAFNFNGAIAGALLGFFRPILVMFGLHYSIMPMQIQQIADLGYSVMLPSALAANLAQGGAALAVAFLTKNKKMKTTASSSALTAVFGVTEPAIYGVTLRYRKPFFAACLSAGIVSAFYGLVNASANAISLPGILSLGTYTADNYVFIILGFVLAFIMGFVFTMIVGIDKSEEPENNESTETKILNMDQVGINNPIKGKVIPLSEVEDNVFSSESMGKGIAIIPSEGIVYAPFDGKVEMIFKTKHAIGLKSDSGVELLIHIGMDTVNLEGKYFEALVEANDSIVKGQKLLTFDLEKVSEKGYSLVTPVIITNWADYQLNMEHTDFGSTLNFSDEVFSVGKI